MNAAELIEFNRDHSTALEFMAVATDDYTACRCCLLHGLFPGLRLGAEAVEKYLKAFILFHDPSVEMKYGHRIKEIAAAAGAIESRIESRFNPVRFSEIFDRLETHYRNRYPDARNFTREASTAELADIDELILYICACLPIPEVPKFRNVGPFFFVCCAWLPPLTPYTKWLTEKNLALNRVKPILIQRYQAVEEQLAQRPR